MLADFGIALAVKEAGGNRLTETGLSLGTPQYMSPEQATGDRALDARSDIYSLGAVLYEMLAGEPPVTGATAHAMIAKLLTERPTSVRVVRDTVPIAIDAAVTKALAKVPADGGAATGRCRASRAALELRRGGGHRRHRGRRLDLVGRFPAGARTRRTHRPQTDHLQRPRAQSVDLARRDAARLCRDELRFQGLQVRDRPAGRWRHSDATPRRRRDRALRRTVESGPAEHRVRGIDQRGIRTVSHLRARRNAPSCQSVRRDLLGQRLAGLHQSGASESRLLDLFRRSRRGGARQHANCRHRSFAAGSRLRARFEVDRCSIRGQRAQRVDLARSVRARASSARHPTRSEHDRRRRTRFGCASDRARRRSNPLSAELPSTSTTDTSPAASTRCTASARATTISR